MTPPAPPAPRYPTGDAERIAYQEQRSRLIHDDFDDVASDYIDDVAGEDVAEHWGLPDTALNPISAATRQLVTPGLYGVTPTARVEGDQFVLDALRACKYWQRSQYVQFLTVGMGIAFRRLSVRSRPGYTPRLVDLPVRAHHVWHVRTHPDDPLEIVELWHARIRRSVWTYDVWRLDEVDGKVIGTVEVREIDQDGTPGKLTSTPITGSAFPCLDELGNAVLPWVVCRASESDTFWPLHWRRSAHRGSLQATMAWTYTNRTALFATGESHVIFGVDPQTFPHDIERPPDSGAEARAKSRPQPRVRLHPNSMLLVPPQDGGGTVQDVKIGPGVNLPNTVEYAQTYSAAVYAADGLKPSDQTRQHANPTSGAALEVSNRDKREFALQVEPLALAADMEAIRIATYLLRGTVPSRGEAPVTLPDPATYSIGYHTVPLTPTELADLREQLDWEKERGHTSTIGEHMRLHPGKTEAQALADLVSVRVDEERLRRTVDTALREDERVATLASPADVAPEAPPLATTALNGAQVTAAQAIVEAVAGGRMPRATAAAMLAAFFQLDDTVATAILAPLDGFVQPAPPVPVPPGNAPPDDELDPPEDGDPPEDDDPQEG